MVMMLRYPSVLNAKILHVRSRNVMMGDNSWMVLLHGPGGAMRSEAPDDR